MGQKKIKTIHIVSPLLLYLSWEVVVVQANAQVSPMLPREWGAGEFCWPKFARIVPWDLDILIFYQENLQQVSSLGSSLVFKLCLGFPNPISSLCSFSWCLWILSKTSQTLFRYQYLHIMESARRALKMWPPESLRTPSKLDFYDGIWEVKWGCSGQVGTCAESNWWVWTHN